jgi:hypothetical protein
MLVIGGDILISESGHITPFKQGLILGITPKIEVRKSDPNFEARQKSVWA